MRWVLVVLLWCVTPARADDDTRQRAEQAMQRGMAATARNDHAAALAAYLEAAQLVPDANVPHKLAGEAYEALDRPVDAVTAYARYIELRPDATGVPEIRARIEKLEREKIGTLEVRCTPTGALVYVDHKSVGTTPLVGVQFRAPAKLAIEVVGGLHRPHRETVDLQPGRATAIKCVLQPIVLEGASKRVDAIPHLPPPKRDKPWYRRWSVLGPAIGIAAAAVGTGLYFAFSDGIPSTDGGSHTFP